MGEGLSNFQSVLEVRLDFGFYYYLLDLVIDQLEWFIMVELIWEQILLFICQEVFYFVAIVIEKVEEMFECINVFVVIIVERGF